MAGFVALVNGSASHIPLRDGSVQCCITSPPYYGLRRYDGDQGIEWPAVTYRPMPGMAEITIPPMKAELGLEPTPEMYVGHLVLIFREVWRVLRNDGVAWINLGDSFVANRGNTEQKPGYDNKSAKGGAGLAIVKHRKDVSGLKPKDLMGIPWRVALALQAPWTTVSDCAWSEVDRAWMAAMFDGEGCIGIRKFSSYREEKRQVYQDGFVVYTVVTNSDIDLLDRCIGIAGFGKARIKQQRSGMTDKRGIRSRRDSYGWRLDGNAAVEVIRGIYPYLIAKKKQALIAYTLDQLNKRGRAERGNGPVPEEMQAKRAYLKELINRCNQREEVDLPSWIEEPGSPRLEDGWYLRSDIIWAKPNPLPESVRDRCTKSHEYVFMLTKSERYFYDNEAIKEPVAGSSVRRISQETFWQQEGGEKDYRNGANPNRSARKTIENFARSSRDNFRRENSKRGQVIPGQAVGTHRPDRDDSDYDLGTRNKRSVWSVSTRPYPGSHYAVFPEALIEPMILASTSERGACGECGVPWRRVVEKPQPPETLRNRGNGSKMDFHSRQTGSGQKLQDRYDAHPAETTGWRPTCLHYPRVGEWQEYVNNPDDDPEIEAENERIGALRVELLALFKTYKAVPSIVLDPFCGSGTTGVVSRKHGRSAVLLDISQPYLAEQARARLELDKIDAWQTGKGIAADEAPLDGLPLFNIIQEQS